MHNKSILRFDIPCILHGPPCAIRAPGSVAACKFSASELVDPSPLTMAKAPANDRELFSLLVGDLENYGPIRTNWRNFSALSLTTYHCHLNYSWVACWLWEKDTLYVEVYYAGSREDAPY